MPVIVRYKNLTFPSNIVILNNNDTLSSRYIKVKEKIIIINRLGRQIHKTFWNF